MCIRDSSSTQEPPYELAHGNGDLLDLSWDAMFWVNNYVANQAYNRYSQMIPDIRRVQSGLEDAMKGEVAEAEVSLKGKPFDDQQAALAEMTTHWAGKATADYKALGDYLLVKYLDGNIKREKDGKFERNEAGMPVQPLFGGYDNRYFRSIVEGAGDRLKVVEPAPAE